MGSTSRIHHSRFLPDTSVTSVLSEFKADSKLIGRDATRQSAGFRSGTLLDQRMQRLQQKRNYGQVFQYALEDEKPKSKSFYQKIDEKIRKEEEVSELKQQINGYVSGKPAFINKQPPKSCVSSSGKSFAHLRSRTHKFISSKEFYNGKQPPPAPHQLVRASLVSQETQGKKFSDHLLQKFGSKVGTGLYVQPQHREHLI
jgi:hypothetical protein